MPMPIRSATLAALALALALPSTATAKPENKGQLQAAGHGQGHTDHAQHGGDNAKGKAKGKAGAGNRHNGLACPPGLARKPQACIPPGQLRKGDRLPDSWASHYSRYDSLPDFFRSRYRLDSRYRYVQNEGRVLVVDAASRAILDVVTR
jgi:hypothetical protein